MSKILVTGVNGFVGEHLTHELVNHGQAVVGIGIQPEPSQSHASLLDSYFACDLTVPEQVDTLPWSDIDSVIHLAGLSAVGPSFDQPQTYFTINTNVLIGLFEGAMRAGEKRPRIVSISTGAVYAASDEPLTENSDTDINSPYAASKLASEIVTLHYRGRGFTDSINVRPFNHIGPHQGPGFFVPDMALQIKDAPQDSTIMVGNITTSRDYTDVRDVVRAYRMLCEAPTLHHTLYNICSGTSVAGEVILDKLRSIMQRQDLKIEVDQARVRPTDTPKVVGSFDRLRQDIGWEPERSIDASLTDFVHDL